MTPSLFALFLGAFAIGTTEFVPAGVLPNIASDLGVTIPTAGYLISAYAAGVAIGGPIVAIGTAGFERKATLLGLMAVFVVGNLLCALAPSYGWLMGARLVVSLTHGSYLGIAIVIATTVAAPDRRATAVAMVISGISAANVIGVPLGTAIGNALSWRATFVAVALIGIVAVAAAALWVPRAGGGEGGAERAITAEIKVLRHQEVWLSFVIIVVIMTGFFAMFAYITPLMTNTVGVTAGYLPFALGGLGAAAFLANIVGGRLGDWNLMGSVLAVLTGVVVADLVLLGFVQYLVAGIVLLLIWQFLNFAVAVPIQTRILNGARSAPNLAATLVSTAFNIGISIGAAIGSVFLAHGMPYGRLPALGVVTSVLGIVLCVISRGMERRGTVAAEEGTA